MFAALLSLFVLVVAIALFLPDRQYQFITEKLLQELTDREVTIGQLVTQRGLNPGIEIKDFSISNASWADSGQMISAAHLFISLDLKQLLERRLVVHDLSASALRINLRRDRQGQPNWQFKDTQAGQNRKFELDQLPQIFLSDFKLNDTQISYVDEEKKLKYRLDLLSFRLANVPQKPDRQQIDAQGVFNDLPFSLSGEAASIESIMRNDSIPFDIRSKLNQSDLAIAGELADISGDVRLSTSIIASSRSLTDFSAFTVNRLPSIGPIEITADIDGNLKNLKQQGVDVTNLRVDVDDPVIKLDVGGELSALGATNAGNVSIDLNVPELPELTRLLGLTKTLPGSVTLSATAQGSGEDFDLNLSSATLDSRFLKAQISGQVDDLVNKRQARLNVEASAPNLEFLTQVFGWKLPLEWGPLEASAKLEGDKDRYVLEQIQGQMSGKSKAVAAGRIGNLNQFDDMEFDVEASLATLAEISAFTKKPLPQLGPITAVGKIHWRQRKLSLADAVANYSGQYGQAEVSGGIGDLIRFDLVRLKAAANLPDLSVAELFFGLDLPELKGIQATADLVSPVARDLSAINLKASHQGQGVEISATGSIDSLIKNRAIMNLDVAGEIDSLARVNAVFDTKLPDFGPLSATAKLTGATKDIRIDDMVLLLTNSALYGTLRGDPGKITEIEGIDLDVQLSTPGVDILFEQLDRKSTIRKPASFSGQFSFRNGSLSFENSELNLGSDTVIGDLYLFNFFDKAFRPKITGKINILNLNLLSIHGNESVDVKQKNRDKFLSTEPLPYEFIETTDMDLDINIGRLRSQVFDVTNSSFEVRSSDGEFRLGPFAGELSGGKAQFQVDINAKSRPTRTKVNIDIQGFDMAQAGSFRDSKLIQSQGDAYLNLKLDSVGRTLASIMANASGGGALYFEDLLLYKGALDLFASDLFKKTLNAINPFRKRSRNTEIRCAAFAFSINDGFMITPFGIAAEASEYSVTGNGKVNFKNEAIDLVFRTKVKKLLAVNPFERLTGLVKVAGKLNAPVVTFNPRGIFEIGATVGAAVYTGGLSLLAQDQIEKLNAKSELCSKALGKAG